MTCRIFQVCGSFFKYGGAAQSLLCCVLCSLQVRIYLPSLWPSKMASILGSLNTRGSIRGVKKVAQGHTAGKQQDWGSSNVFAFCSSSRMPPRGDSRGKNSARTRISRIISVWGTGRQPRRKVTKGKQRGTLDIRRVAEAKKKIFSESKGDFQLHMLTLAER